VTKLNLQLLWFSPSNTKDGENSPVTAKGSLNHGEDVELKGDK